MLSRKSELPFVYDSSSLFLPWMVMLMVFIAILASAGGMALNSTLHHWNRAISGSLTVQIPTHDRAGVTRGKQVQKDIARTIEFLLKTPGIEKAEQLSKDQMRKLMDPWLGDLDDFSDLPLPELIDVTLKKDYPVNFEELKEKLEEIVPSASMDMHRVWLERLIALAEGIKKITTLVLLLLILTTSLTVIYSTRSSLAVHKPAIELLHMMGAKDSYICVQYAFRTFRMSLIGGLAGLALALPVIITISTLVAQLKGGFITTAQGQPFFWPVVFSLPFVASFLSVATAYITVSRHLKKFL